jgi:hypothetical protein
MRPDVALSAFDDRSRPPTARELKNVLRGTAGLWRELVAQVSQNHGPITELWNFAGAQFGWSLRLKRKDRVVVYMTPQAGHFLVGVVLGDKAVERAHEVGLPEAVFKLIDNAPRYAEGRGIRLTVATRDDLRIVQRLAAAKMGR